MERSVGFLKSWVLSHAMMQVYKDRTVFPNIQLKPFKLLQIALKNLYATTVSVKYEIYILETSTRNRREKAFLA